MSSGAGRMVIQNLLKRMAGHKPDVIVVKGLSKRDLPAPAQCVPMRCDQDQVIDGERKGFHLGSGNSLIAGDPYIGEVRGDGADNLAARPLFQVDIDIRMSREEPTQGGRQELFRCRCIGKQMNMASQSFGVFRQFAAHAFQLESDHSRVMCKGRSGRSRTDAAPTALEQRRPQCVFHGANALARRSQCHPGAGRAVGDAACLYDVQKQPQVSQIKAYCHGSTSLGFDAAEAA